MWKFILAGLGCRRFGPVVEGISERDLVDVVRQIRIDDETHRHIASLADAEVLRTEAEALGLVKVLRGDGRRDARHGLRDRSAARQVLGIELRVVKLARMHTHGGYLR